MGKLLGFERFLGQGWSDIVLEQNKNEDEEPAHGFEMNLSSRIISRRSKSPNTPPIGVTTSRLQPSTKLTLTYGESEFVYIDSS